MSVVVHRTTFEFHVGEGILGRFLEEANGGPWVHDPDVTAVLSGSTPIVPVVDWIWTSDLVREMTQPEKDARDLAETDAAHAETEARIKEDMLSDPLTGLTTDVAISGLDITVNIESMVVDDLTSIVADPTDTKTVMVCYIYNTVTDVFTVAVYEKTTGLYADMLMEEDLVRCFGEWEVVAQGTVLTEV